LIYIGLLIEADPRVMVLYYSGRKIMVNDIQPLTAIHDDGMDARDGGHPVGACPYPPGSDERQEWLEGWHERDSREGGDAATVERFLPREA
jgi:ribosome modulation factor